MRTAEKIYKLSTEINDLIDEKDYLYTHLSEDQWQSELSDRYHSIDVEIKAREDLITILLKEEEK